MAKAKLGSGKRFKALTKKLAARRGKRKVRNPKALSAWIGRKNLGASKMAQLSAAGRKRAARARGGKSAADTLYG